MDGLYLPKCQELILLENQKKGLCLISAFFQGLFYQDHTREGHILEEIVKAMTFVINNSTHFTPESVNIIDKWNGDLVNSIESGNPLKAGEFWNIEILENYIQKANIQRYIFYYREIPNEQKFVLVKTRQNLTCPPSNSKCLIFVELTNKHKLLVEQLPGERDCRILFQNTDFTLPISYDFNLPNYLASFTSHKLFLPIHLARLIKVTHFGACGYKCFSDIRVFLFNPPFSFYFLYFNDNFTIVSGYSWTTLLHILGGQWKDSPVEKLVNKSKKIYLLILLASL